MISFRFADIPVRVQPFFLLLVALLGLSYIGEASNFALRMGVWVVVVFTGVLAHELGHAFVGRAFGLTPRIELHGFGGATSFGAAALALSPAKRILLSLAGPGVGIGIGAIAGIALLVASPQSGAFAHFTLMSLVWVNLGWGVLNLIPMLPLDGGNVMSSFFELVFGPGGVKAARVLSLVLAVGLVVLALYANNFFMAAIIGFLAWTNVRALRLELRVGVDKPLVIDLARAEQQLKDGELRGAAELGLSVAARAQTDAVRTDALTITMLARLSANDAFGARAALEQVPKGRSIDPGIHGAVLLATGEASAAFDLLSTALSVRTSPFVEQRFAEATIRSGNFERAAELLDSKLGRALTVDTLEQIEKAAYEAEAHAAAARISTVLWDIDHLPSRAYNVACSLARAGRLDEAMGWLDQARKAGFDKLDKLDRDADLVALRRRSDWSAVRAAFETA